MSKKYRGKSEKYLPESILVEAEKNDDLSSDMLYKPVKVETSVFNESAELDEEKEYTELGGKGVRLLVFSLVLILTFIIIMFFMSISKGGM